MAECIYFENIFQWEPFIRAFNPENCKEWTIEEKWSVNPSVIQEISLAKEDEYFESFYYVDLEIVSVFQKCSGKIFKSGRFSSDNIRFLIYGHEYSCFATYFRFVDDISDSYAQGQMYQYKITLTPILQFTNEIFRKPGKLTKIDILKGLRTLSNNIVSLKDDEFSDVILYCGDQRVKAHRNILTARSELFSNFFHDLQQDKDDQSNLEVKLEIYDLIKQDNDDSTNNDSADYINAESDNDCINADCDDDTINDNSVDYYIDGDDDPINGHRDDHSINNDNGDFTNDIYDAITIYAEKDNKVENVLKLKPEIYGGDITDETYTTDNDAQAILRVKDNEVRNVIKISEINSDGTKDEDSTITNHDATAIHAEKDIEVRRCLEIKPEINGDNVINGNASTNDNDATAIHASKNNEVQNYFKAEQEFAFNDDANISALPRKEDKKVQQCLEIEAKNVQNRKYGVSVLSPEKKGVKNCLKIELESAFNDANGILAMSTEENIEAQHLEVEPKHEFNNCNCTLSTSPEEGEVNIGLEKDSGESNVIRIRLQNIHPSIFGEFIDFIYSGQYTASGIKNAKDLLLAARSYGIYDLEYKCITYLKLQISVGTMEDIYNFASECRCEKLQMYVLDYAKDKIVGRRRRDIYFIRIIEQQANDEIENEADGMTQAEMMSWLEKMRNHPTYLSDIITFKKGKKIRDVFKIVFPEINLYHLYNINEQSA